ncbi:MAG: GNAT family N-acetyltransferase [Dolichospermum sp.]
MDVRQATFNDINALAVLFDQYRVFYQKPSDIDAAIKFLTDRFNQNESVIFVAQEGDRLVGFTQLYPLFSSTRMKRLWLLNDLFVESSFRGRGISVALIEKAKQHCRATGACALTLETAKSNTVGNNLYPRAGFTLDIDHNYYSWDVTP